jgi:cell division protein ZapA (FtsZ GTPase activity inhibitor)
MDGNKWAEIREENRAIMENVQQYLATLNTARELLDSSQEQMERTRLLLDHYRRMRQLSHAAEVQIAKASECLMVDVVRSEAMDYAGESADEKAVEDGGDEDAA